MPVFTSEHYDADKILFFDLRAIYDMDGVVRKWHRPVKRGIVLRPEREYEGDMTLPVAIYPSPDGRRIVCHYACLNSAEKFPELKAAGMLHCNCLAHSEDGFHWERPNLGLTAFHGSTENNIAQLADVEFKIVADPRDPDAARRLKGIALTWPNAGKRVDPDRPGSRVFCTATSPDGLRWSKPVALPQFIETGDTSGLTYDERRGLFLFTTRPVGYWVGEEFPKLTSRPIKKNSPDGRWVALSTSRDFVNWTPLDLMLVRDGKDEEGVDFYCAVFFPYGDLYLGLLRRHHFWHGMMDTELVWGNDCVRWNRSYYRQPFIGPGDLGEPDWCFGDLINCKPIRSGNELLFFYEGRNHVHAPHAVKGTVNAGQMDAAMGVATLRVDGFASLEAGTYGGHLTTEPLPAAGKRVIMNVRTVGAGYVSVELLDRRFQPLAKTATVISGDETALELRFDGSARLPRTEDGTVVLRMYLENAALYSLAVRE